MSIHILVLAYVCECIKRHAARRCVRHPQPFAKSKRGYHRRQERKFKETAKCHALHV